MRTDKCGIPINKCVRFMLEVAETVIQAISADKARIYCKTSLLALMISKFCTHEQVKVTTRPRRFGGHWDTKLGSTIGYLAAASLKLPVRPPRVGLGVD
jgi:hypothetical protein